MNKFSSIIVFLAVFVERAKRAAIFSVLGQGGWLCHG